MTMSDIFTRDPTWEARRQLLALETQVLEVGIDEVAETLGVSTDSLLRVFRGPGFPTLHKLRLIMTAAGLGMTMTVLPPSR